MKAATGNEVREDFKKLVKTLDPFLFTEALEQWVNEANLGSIRFLSSADVTQFHLGSFLELLQNCAADKNEINLIASMFKYDQQFWTLFEQKDYFVKNGVVESKRVVADPVYILQYCMGSGILMAISQMQKDLGMISDKELEKLTELCVSQEGKLDVELVELIAQKQKGKGMLTKEQCEELSKINFAERKDLAKSWLGNQKASPKKRRLEKELNSEERELVSGDLQNPSPVSSSWRMSPEKKPKSAGVAGLGDLYNADRLDDEYNFSKILKLVEEQVVLPPSPPASVVLPKSQSGLGNEGTAQRKK